MTFTLSRLCLQLAAPALLATTSLAQLPGSIYTTDETGTPQDVFLPGAPVYLAGGPAPGAGPRAAGLRDGVYVFQVTDSAGTTLLSSDAITNRRVIVRDGAIRGVSPGGHPVLPGPSGTVLVNLGPYVADGDSQAELRVWLTLASSYLPNGGMGTSGSVFGFQLGQSLTDSHRVWNHDGRGLLTVGGTVYWDYNRNGIYQRNDPNEVPIHGWKVRLTWPGGMREVLTDANGAYEFILEPNSLGNHVESIPPAPGFIPNPGGRWLATTPTVTPNPLPPANHATVDFGNLYFENNPGTARSIDFWQSPQGEELLQGTDPNWRIALSRLCLRTNLTSPPFPVEDTFLEVPLEVFGPLSDDDDDKDPPTGFDIAYDVVTTWLDDPVNDVLAFELSRRFSAAQMNLSAGPLHNLPTFVDRFGNDVLVDLDFMVMQTNGLLCMDCSANTGTDGDQDCRDLIMGCLMEWEELNSSGTRTYTRSGNGPPPVVY